MIPRKHGKETFKLRCLDQLSFLEEHPLVLRRNLTLCSSAQTPGSHQCKWCHPLSSTSNGLCWDVQSNTSYTSLPLCNQAAVSMLWRSLLERCLLPHLIKIPCTSHFSSSTFPITLPRYHSCSPWSGGEYDLACCDLRPLLWVYSIPLLKFWPCNQYLQPSFKTQISTIPLI